MDLLFKVTNTPQNGDKPKILNTNLADHFPAVHQSMAWQSMKPYIRQATRSYILKYIDQATYDALATKFQDDAAMNDTEKAFLEKMQDAIAYYAVWKAMPHLNITIGDKGVQQTVSSEGNSMPSSQWAFKVARWETIREADDLMDHLLTWIEEKIAANDTLFDDFKGSDTYKVGRISLFKTPGELQEFIDIRNSRRTFLALITHLEKAAKKHVIPVICDELWEEIVTQHRANNLSATNEKLLPYLQAVIAEWGAWQAIPGLTIVMEQNGFKIVSESDGMSHRSNLQNEEHLKSIQALRYQLESDAKQSKSELFNFIYNNADDYPLFKNSDCYIDDDEDEDSVVCVGDGGVML